MNQRPSWDQPMRVVQVTPPPPGVSLRTTVPENWEQLPILHVAPWDSDPSAFMPLASFMVDAGSMIVGISSRPAHSVGSPEVWLRHLCRQLGFLPGPATTLQDLNPGVIASCYASQATNRGPMPMRLILFQERGHWVLVTAMAVSWQWETFEFDLLRMLGSLEILGSQPALAPNTIIPFPEDLPAVPDREDRPSLPSGEILRFASI